MKITFYFIRQTDNKWAASKSYSTCDSALINQNTKNIIHQEDAGPSSESRNLYESFNEADEEYDYEEYDPEESMSK